MSKEIQLYSEDGKYMCAVELSETQDRFKCPDHSVMTLLEKREKGDIYLIAEAFDKTLVTEKDKRINQLELDNKILNNTINIQIQGNTELAIKYEQLKAKIKDLAEENQRLKEEQVKYELGYTGNVRKSQRNRIEQLEKQVKEQGEELQQLYSHLGVEAFGEDIQEQAVKEIDRLKGE